MLIQVKNIFLLLIFCVIVMPTAYAFPHEDNDTQECKALKSAAIAEWRKGIQADKAAARTEVGRWRDMAKAKDITWAKFKDVKEDIWEGFREFRKHIWEYQIEPLKQERREC